MLCLCCLILVLVAFKKNIIGYSSKDTATLPDEVVGTPEA